MADFNITTHVIPGTEENKRQYPGFHQYQTRFNSLDPVLEVIVPRVDANVDMTTIIMAGWEPKLSSDEALAFLREIYKFMGDRYTIEHEPEDGRKLYHLDVGPKAGNTAPIDALFKYDDSLLQRTADYLCVNMRTYIADIAISAHEKETRVLIQTDYDVSDVIAEAYALTVPDFDRTNIAYLTKEIEKLVTSRHKKPVPKQS